MVENVADELENVLFYDVDVDNSLEFMQQYCMMSIPTLILFKNGEEVDRITVPEPTEDTIITFAKQ
ncbi:thioredoxin family protein [Virgibacillus dakarensis]|uniref:thioredoxin family protein n=1 Tax=Virgibacillus dakarensis TaxID=1917889 RepID=UPI00389AB562